jgi:hypothetical protein
MTWTAIGAAGLVAGATIAGFELLPASPADRAVRPISLPTAFDPVTGERRSWIDGGDPTTGPAGPAVTISPQRTPAPTDSVADTTASPEVVSRPIVTVQPAASPDAAPSPETPDTVETPDVPDDQEVPEADD